jgi:hypothetical protein
MVNGHLQLETTITIYHSPFTIYEFYGKEIINCEIAAETEICGARLHALQAVWPVAGIPAEV